MATASRIKMYDATQLGSKYAYFKQFEDNYSSKLFQDNEK